MYLVDWYLSILIYILIFYFHLLHCFIFLSIYFIDFLSGQRSTTFSSPSKSLFSPNFFSTRLSLQGKSHKTIPTSPQSSLNSHQRRSSGTLLPLQVSANDTSCTSQNAKLVFCEMRDSCSPTTLSNRETQKCKIAKRS